MSCTVCGSNVPCGCVTNGTTCNPGCNPCATVTPSTGCAPCNSSNCNTGCCTPVLPANPSPYYNCAGASPQSHLQKITIQQFSYDLKITSSWNIPACGESAVVVSTALKAFNVGSYIWNSEFGYFEVTAVNLGTGQLTLVNHCNDGNAAVGTNVPECSEWTVTVPPCDCGNDQGPCVAVDFTAPDVDDCIDITLNTVTGISAGDTVQIGSGFYLVQEVKPNNIINICNTGDGITPGTAVIALNAAGDFQYCLTIISANPCTRDSVFFGKTLVCNAENSATTAQSNGKYWVWTADAGLDTARFLPLGEPSVCTTLSGTFSIVAGTANYTNVPVADSSIFVLGDIVIFDNRVDRFQINNIPSGSLIDGFFTSTPGDTTDLPLGTSVCTIGCCESNASYLHTALNNRDPGASNLGSGTINSGTPTFTSSTATVPLTNSSPFRYMAVQLIFAGYFVADMDNANTDPFEVLFELQWSIDANPLTTRISRSEYFFAKDDNTHAAGREITLPNYFTLPEIIAPGATVTINMRVRATITAAGTGAYIISASNVGVNAIGVNIG